jgi:hypothetical protein
MAVAEESTATEAEEEALAEAGLVDIASILGAPTVTVVLSHLIFQRKPNASHMCARIKFTHI